jgi:hypothetical protein
MTLEDPLERKPLPADAIPRSLAKPERLRLLD